jgi:polar amino acid transport system permease protein
MSSRDLAILWQERDVVLNGLLLTFEIVVVSALLAGALSLVIFSGLISRFRTVSTALTRTIDLMRCVPFMLVCYLIYFALPYGGIFIGSAATGILALTVYNAVYLAELLHGAWKELPRDITEAGAAFGFHGFGLMRIVLPPVVLAAIPMIGNQMIQIIKDSAFLVIITVKELTYAANAIQSTYYIPLASFLMAMLIYWFLCLGVEGGVRALLRRAEARR